MVEWFVLGWACWVAWWTVVGWTVVGWTCWVECGGEVSAFLLMCHENVWVGWCVGKWRCAGEMGGIPGLVTREIFGARMVPHEQLLLCASA